MIVDLNGNRFLVKWRHFRPNQVETKPNGGTECAIYRLDGEDQTMVTTASIQCYYKDCFSKETGRKISLKRSLEQCSHFTKNSRKVFWDAYFNRKNS